MKSILDLCKPRADILGGSFNPEIFTANLNEVIEFYQDQDVDIETVYTDADQFFGQATYPTTNLVQLLNNVFGRLSGDNARSAIQRLETAFGGGKTHALIACAHIAYLGTELKEVTSNIIDKDLLPKPGEISVVGVRGDEIPIHKTKGTALIPYTLWGEIAYQIGGEDLYEEVKEEVTSHAAPGKPYFDKVLGGRKTLIMLDELAQYAARLEAARPDGGKQLAAFLFALHSYARTHSGIAIVVTLAGRTDAFSKETSRLASLLSEVKGEEVDETTAQSVGQKAVDEVESVAFRDAAPGLVPVQPGELSRVLAQRLLEEVNREEARGIASAYHELYEKNARLLPDVAVREDYLETMVDNYPFHPTLIDYLNNKLATAENFQGTRGVLRVLALAIRSIWKNHVEAPMIHTCHLDLRDSATAGELLGRTGSSDLFAVLNADVGGPDTEQLQGNRSHAEEADLNNPHPQDFSMYEYTWKTVFLHSLVGREEGLGSQVFGLSEPDALFQVAFPGLTPPQVKKALEKIEDLEGGAFYLRFKDGRYYASVDPSVRVALSRIWNSLKSQEDRIQSALNSTARKLVSPDVRTFHVEHDVYAPEHIPDNQTNPVLGLVALDAQEIDVESIITTKGPNHQARERQNLVFLLIPNTVKVDGKTEEIRMFGDRDRDQALTKIRDSARWALAIRELKKRPQDYGINAARLDQDDFRRRATEREKALETSVTEAYNRLWFPSASGDIVQKEIKTAGGESGASVIERIRKILLDDNELITKEHTDLATLTKFKELFFRQSQTPSVKEIRANFLSKRDWPVLESVDVLEQILRAGVTKGVWCIFRMGDMDQIQPDEFFDQETEVPLGLDLRKDEYSLITLQQAKVRNWTSGEGPDIEEVERWVKEVIAEYNAIRIGKLQENINEKHGELSTDQISEIISRFARQETVYAYQGKENQEDKPQLIYGVKASLYSPSKNDIVLTKSEAAKRGWLSDKPEVFKLSGREAAEQLVSVLNRIGSLYNRGAKSAVKEFDLVDLELEKGGKLRIGLHDVPAESMKNLGELFGVIAGITQIDHDTEGFLVIEDPSEDCLFLKELLEDKGKSE